MLARTSRTARALVFSSFLLAIAPSLARSFCGDNSEHNVLRVLAGWVTGCYPGSAGWAPPSASSRASYWGYTIAVDADDIAGEAKPSAAGRVRRARRLGGPRSRRSGRRHRRATVRVLKLRGRAAMTWCCTVGQSCRSASAVGSSALTGRPSGALNAFRGSRWQAG